jgi:hypothetical protein
MVAEPVDHGTVKQDNLVVQAVADVLLIMDPEIHTVTVLQIAVNDVLAASAFKVKVSQEVAA